MIEEDDYEFVVDCDCMQFRTDRRMIERSGLALLIEKYTMDNFETNSDWQKKVKGVAERFIEDSKGKWLVMLGNSGAGKTMLCTAITSELMKRGYPARYVIFRELTTSLKPLMNTDEYIKEIFEYKRVNVLYIDDFWKNGYQKIPSEADVSIALEILNYRYNNKLTTLISSEHLIDSILAIDEALGSRIFEMCGDQYLIQIDKDLNKNFRLRNY
ncbi:MAG: ATP-binding protein [Erysipelotrichaceae bacterium]|nr:ATP-binding protein [Erysipelotrichaceae bacterium]